MKNIVKKIMKSSKVYKIRKKYIVKYKPIEYTEKLYYKFYGRNLDIENPKLLSEKLQYLKLFEYPKDKKIIKAADKYNLQFYLKEKKLSEYVVPFIAVFEQHERIDIEKLPNSFVLKKTNASGYNLLVKEKRQITNKQVNKITSKWFKNDFGLDSGERHYSKGHSRVICEPFFNNLGNEYRLFMISGEIGYIQVITWDWTKKSDSKSIKNKDVIEGQGKHYRLHYDKFWNLLHKDNDIPDVNIEIPKDFETMVNVSKIIGKDFSVVRIDFNEINGRLKISELTFTPASGFLEILKQKPELDEYLGKKIKIGHHNEKGD